MNRLVSDFTVRPNVTNARRIVNYLNRHPMAECLTGPYQAIAIGIARDMIARLG